MQNKNNIWKIFSIVAIIIIVILIICIILISSKSSEASSNKTNETPKTTTNTAKHNDDMIRISLDEDFSKDGTENVRWSDARIRQYDNEMEISIMLNNDSETEVIEARTLEMVLLDKEGKQIIAKDIEMGEIPAKYGYTTLETTIENVEPLLVYDVQLKAK